MIDRLLEVAVMVIDCVLSLAGPALIPKTFTVCKPGFTFTTRLPRESMLGGSFTGVTVTVKELVKESTPAFAVPALSVRIMVMTVLPDTFVAGVKVREPVALPGV